MPRSRCTHCMWVQTCPMQDLSSSLTASSRIARRPRSPQEKKKKYEPPAPPPRVGKKQKKRDQGAGLGSKLPTITPTARCKLRLLKLERVKDYLLMEEEWVKNQELLKPHEERNEEDRSKVLCNSHVQFLCNSHVQCHAHMERRAEGGPQADVVG